MNREINKPFPSKAKNKKFSVFVIADNGKKRLINFGDSRYTDFRQGASNKKRKAYRARARGITNKKGEKVYLKKNTPAYWAYNYSW